MDNIPPGEQLRLDGMAQAIRNAPTWAEQARIVIEHLAATGLAFTSEEVVDRIGLPRGRVGTNQNNAVGAVMSGAARRGIIRQIGYRKATRPRLHSAVVAVWVGN